MSHSAEHGVLELPRPRRSGRQPLHDYTAERLAAEKAALGNAEGAEGTKPPEHEAHPRSPLGGTPSLNTDGGTQGGAIQNLPLQERLLAFYGGGERPDLRRMLFARLQYLVQRYGRPAETLVRECCIKAAAADQPGNYFCRVVRLKLAEATFMEVPL